MDVWRCIEIINRTNEWFFQKEKFTKEKLLALNILAKIGSPSIIHHIIPTLKTDSLSIRSASLQTIETLFEKINSKKAYYSSLKYCSISRTDLEFYHRTFSPSNYTLLIKIASLNGNGYVREDAVKRLGSTKNPTIIPFLIFRLADWVWSVRYAAQKELIQFLKPEFVEDLISNLSLFQWLKKVERVDNSADYQQIVNYLTQENRQQTIEVFKQVADKERCILARELSASIQSKEEVNLFLNDKHFLIRLLALQYFSDLNEKQRHNLLNDRSARVRMEALNCLEENENFQETLIQYIADRSGSIRYYARFHLKNTKIDFRQFYIDNLVNQEQIIGSLLGLMDLEIKDCTVYILPFLNHEKISVVKTAFFVLTQLDIKAAYTFAKEHLFTRKIGLRNLIITFLGNHSTVEIIKLARDKFDESISEDLKLAILKLFSRIGGYSILPDLLSGVINDEEYIRKQAAIYIQKWKNEAVNNFTRPTEKESKRLLEVIQEVEEINSNAHFIKPELLKQLKFYVKKKY